MLATLTSALQVFGETWSAPISSVTVDDIRGTMEKEVCEREFNLKQKKKESKGSKSKTTGSTPAASNESILIEEDDEIWEVPSEDEDVGPKSSKAKKDTSERDAATAARKQARERETAWKKETIKAAKFVGPLTSTCTNLANVLQKCDKDPDAAPPETLQGLKDAQAKMIEFRTSSWASYKATVNSVG